MIAAKARRERLFKKGKPTVRPAEYNDIRWLWVAAKKEGFDGTPEEFTRESEPLLASADRLYMLEDSNAQFEHGHGPIGLVAANYDGWSLVPHVEWFSWATKKNKLRGTVAFLQSMRYAQHVGIIKIFADKHNVVWFRRLKRYINIGSAGKIPGGRTDGEEYIFYLRGRKRHEFIQVDKGTAARRAENKVSSGSDSNPQTASNTT